MRIHKMGLISVATAAIMGAAVLAAPALAADKVKIGFVTTLTTPAAVIGNDMKDAFDLANEHIGGTMAGLEIEIIYEDDGFKPEIGKQKTDKLVKQDDVDFITGYIWSHVLLASRKSALDAGKFMISANAGPSQLAGKLCHKNFFSTSWQNDQTPMALGEVLNQRGVKSLYIMSPNYAAGKNMAAGVERTFKGEIKGKDMTKWGKDAQLDFSAELAKAKASGTEAIFVFYPGKAGGAFIKQYMQAGLNESIPLYTVYTVDALSLPKFQKAEMKGVLGSLATQFWSPDLDTPQNEKFVSAFLAKYGRYPSFYAAQSYDTLFFIKSAVEAVGGDLTNMDGMRAAMEKADYPSVRGPYSYGNNHFPIQNFYLREAATDSEGRWTTKIVSTVYSNHQDVYAKECKL
ncbi:MAG: ABC transporter substrate-binding protein [Alphaproteobacteria bacterium]|jgi:branched-chain amino acid transport system substrate-binding protein|nr:ABC transporter substrate-binding protein [Alphaproteobacteria bacterium]|tara:strand:- start:451 stop:1656 length:1206 start_codon:yes stop_codon:yes gene_type:complete